WGGGRLRMRLAAVCSGVKGELEERRALHGLRFDALDPVYIKEVVLVVVGEVALHLRGAHSAIGLSDIHNRQVEVGKDINPHTGEGENRAQRHGHNANDDGPGAAERKTNQPHGSVTSAV